MNFKESLKILGIEDYAERIYSSNSHGELFHLQQYFILADVFKDKKAEWFREWFEDTIKFAEKNWERPESVFQHIRRILYEQMFNEKF